MYTHHIDTGSGYVEFHPKNDSQKVKRSREEGYIFARDTFDGSLVFVRSEYTTLVALAASYDKLDYQLKKDGTVIFSGFIDLLGEYSPDENRCELKVITNDNYTTLLSRIDEKIDIINDNINQYAVRLDDYSFDYTRNMYLKDVIQYMVEQIDSNILFDNDSFSCFDSAFTDWENLFIAGLSDIILVGGAESSNPQTIGELSLKDLFDFFAEHLHIYWDIEDVAGSPYFRLKHISEVTFLTSSSFPLDITDAFGINWSEGKSGYEYKRDNRFYKLQRTFVAENPDFIGQDIVINKFINSGSIKKTDVSQFYFDIESTRDNPDKYSSVSTNQFFLFQATEQTSATIIYFTDIEDTELTKVFTNYPAPVGSEQIQMERGGNSGAVQYLVEFGDSPGWGASSFEKGYVYTINFNVSVNNFSKIYIRPEYSISITPNDFTSLFMPGTTTIDFDSGDGRGVTQWVDMTAGGDFSFDILAKYNTVFALEIYIDGGVLGDTFDIQTATGEPRVVKEKKYYSCEKGNVLGGADLYNYKLSLAWIDQSAGTFELPDTTAIINGVSQSVSKKNDKISAEYSIPLYNQTQMNFNYKILTDAGYVEPRELSVSLDGSPAILIGDFQ